MTKITENNIKVYNEFSRGSKWRKWDLHFHTPSSPDYKGNSITNQNIVDVLIKNNVSVVAITDHHKIDVERIKNLQHLGNLGKNKITFLPGIEFRGELFGNEVIHFIGIFSEKCNLQNIWDKIKVKTPIDDFLTGKIREEEICCSLTETSKTIHELGGIITVHAGSKSNSIDKITNAFPYAMAIKIALVKDFDIFELGQEKDIEGYKDKVNPFLKKKIGKTLPLIICSDNHNINEYKVKQNLWIKADPTFEGLKQIIYEPKRAYIGKDKPDKKKGYNVINKVKFKDLYFTEEEIEISQNLTAIIGSKSTGKSILLKNIAKTIDPEEFKKRITSVDLKDSKPIAGMEVYWKDGQVSKLDSNSNPDRKIIYIPQSYLNRVIDHKEKNTDIDDIIKDILLQDDDFKKWNEQLKTKEKGIKNSIESDIKALYENIEIQKENSSKIKDIGDEKGIEEEIKKITQEIKDIQSKLNFEQKDIETFNVQIKEIKNRKLEIEFLEEDIEILKKIKEVSVSIYNAFEFNFKSTSIASEIENIRKSKVEEYSTNWKKGITELIATYIKQSNELKETNKEAFIALITLQEKVDSQKSLSEKYKELEEEEKKQQIAINLEKKKEDAQSAIDKLTSKLSELTSDFYSIYLEIKDIIHLVKLDDELVFDIKTEFKGNDFSEFFVTRFFDGRSINKKDYDYLTKYNFDGKEPHKKFIHKIICEILKNALPLRNENLSKEAITGLLQNWFIHNYKVEYDSDQINDMSPGKRSFVLLRLLIDLDNNKCPILIDQPEDDLDNRSIYTDVVTFFKNRKSERQIIIATHNPNLVLGADAEQVIVANQEGKDTKNKSHQFEYVSGSIEHTSAANKDKETLYKQGIQEHICHILEGGEDAFNKRKNKYNFTKIE